jgi:glutamate transport system substrate-binding protein
MLLTHRFKLLFAGFVAVFALLAMACGDSDEEADEGAAPSMSPMAAATSFPAGSTMDQIVKRGKIVIGVKYDVPLFGLQDPVARKVDGLDVAMGKEIAKALGLQENQVEFVEAVTANRIPFLVEDKADLIISTFTITDARKQEIDFSRPYYKAGQSILVKKDNTTIKSVTDLNGKTVCSQAGSTSEKNVMEKAPQAQMLPLQVISACVQAMKDGRVEAVSTDDIQLAGFASLDNTLKMVGGQFTTELYGIGIKKGKTDLQTFVNTEIGKMLADGRWEKLYTQYLGKVEGLPTASEAKAALPASS